MFTVSPSTVYSFLLMLPISPATALPELMPMRMRSSGPSFRSAFHSASRSCISRAVRIARWAWSGMSSGRAEDGHDRVADVLVERALVA